MTIAMIIIHIKLKEKLSVENNNDTAKIKR